MDMGDRVGPCAAPSSLTIAGEEQWARVVGWELGDEPEIVSARLERVLAGHLCATANLMWLLEARGEPPPRAGDLRLLRCAEGRPRAVIEVIESHILPFDRVDEHFAADVGEGDLSLDYWRATHERVFERQCRDLGRRLDAAVPVVCVRFHVIYAPSSET